jgi:hypothetical protein
LGYDASERARLTYELGDGVLTNITSRSLRITSHHSNWPGGGAATEDILTVYSADGDCLFRFHNSGVLSIANSQPGTLDPVLTQQQSASVGASWTQSGTYTVTGTETIDPSTGTFNTNAVSEASADTGVTIDDVVLKDGSVQLAGTAPLTGGALTIPADFDLIVATEYEIGAGNETEIAAGGELVIL